MDYEIYENKSIWNRKSNIKKEEEDEVNIEFYCELNFLDNSREGLNDRKRRGTTNYTKIGTNTKDIEKELRGHKKLLKYVEPKTAMIKYKYIELCRIENHRVRLYVNSNGLCKIYYN